MIVKLEKLSAWLEDEIFNIQNGGNLTPNMPPWINHYVLRRVRLEEQRAKREAFRD